MTWSHIAALWIWTLGVWIYAMGLRRSPRSRTALILGAVVWPVAAPLELLCRICGLLIRRFLEKVLP